MATGLTFWIYVELYYQGFHLPSSEGFLPPKFVMYPQNFKFSYTGLYIYRGYKTKENQPVYPQLKRSVETLTMRVPKTKALFSCAVSAVQLICAFGFAYAGCWFSDSAAHVEANFNYKNADKGAALSLCCMCIVYTKVRFYLHVSGFPYTHWSSRDNQRAAP